LDSTPTHENFGILNLGKFSNLCLRIHMGKLNLNSF
jgi:hypothetical protein